MAINLDRVIAGVPLKFWLLGGAGAVVVGLIIRNRVSAAAEGAEVAGEEAGVLPTVELSGAAPGDIVEDAEPIPASPPPEAPSHEEPPTSSLVKPIGMSNDVWYGRVGHHHHGHDPHPHKIGVNHHHVHPHPHSGARFDAHHHPHCHPSSDKHRCG
jgi:hypothetical protein